MKNVIVDVQAFTSPGNDQIIFSFDIETVCPTVSATLEGQFRTIPWWKIPVRPAPPWTAPRDYSFPHNVVPVNIELAIYQHLRRYYPQEPEQFLNQYTQVVIELYQKEVIQ